jgi:hypothetical protein
MINNNSKQNTNPKSPTEENISTTVNKSQNLKQPKEENVSTTTANKTQI